MTCKIVVGLDGTDAGQRALAYTQSLARQLTNCDIVAVYVIEWSPFTFQTPEENEQRHKRREEEISVALTRVVNPAVETTRAAGFTATGVVRHGDVAETLNTIAVEENADLIVVGRTSKGGLSKRIFGSAVQHLVMHADRPVTVVGEELNND